MEVKKSEEILAEIYRNCQLALESISDILPEIEDEGIKAEILRQHEEYEKICGRAACLARDKALELKEPNPMKKAMMWGSIKMNTLTDNSRAHIAEMMIQGSTMGVTKSLRTLRDCHPKDPKVKDLADKLLKTEQANIEEMKGFL